jgi:Fe-S-cluster containining protein
MDDLDRLHADIDARVLAIRAGAPDWPCAKGCDTCCRHLADVPSLTAMEWKRLRDALAALPERQREHISRAVAALPEAPAGPVVCPLLDGETGACPVYACRPVACRTYGFYVQRDRGLYCRTIEVQAAAGALADTVWGNHDAVDCRLAALGETRPLTAWFRAAPA